MKKYILNFVIFSLTSLVIIACGSEQSQTAEQDAPVLTTNNNSPAPKQITSETNAPDPVEEAENSAKTSIAFGEEAHDFGTITQGDVVEYDFTFTNTGDIPLVIKDVTTPCGCTVPSYPEDPVAPGATGQIKVKFNSSGKSGKQLKKVGIIANTDPVQTYVTISAEVAK